ncbi:HAMP domain-containing sensor histidine kinase [Streptococcus pacificus]|uniref:histidine kinase n=1 Tax=Streptococcus pacificus TaxID=2740577 RepID=A0ABS0ZHZ9_9STRE|nr:HAMP domain-containing sensor histidine kinase [Streptococcus pacificus]MBJ8325629.1 HAMP domain-containing histidine kinase [Streptococcus pacificus]
MSFPNKKTFSRKRSIITTITLWYSFFIFIILIAVVIASFFVSRTISETAGQRELQSQAIEMVEELDEDDDELEEFESFDDGIYYAIYDSSNQVLQGSFPHFFDAGLPFKPDKISDVTNNGRTFQYYDLAIANSNQWLRAIRVKNQMGEGLRTLLTSVIIVLPLVMFFVIVGGYLILKKSFQPIKKITATAQEITNKKDYSKRIAVSDKGDELTNLAQVINTMLASIDQSFKREKQFNNDVSHELRTPVTVILSESEYGKDYADTMEDAKESFNVIHRQSQLMKKMVEQILELTRAENKTQLTMETIDFSQFVNQFLEDSKRLFNEQSIFLDTQIEEGINLVGDPILLKRLIDNLISNAVKFTKDKIRVSLSQSENNIILSIKDNGQGIAKQELEKIWHRFYRIDSSRHTKGVGLGLSLVKEIATLHQAQVRVESELGHGSDFKVIFKTNR